MKRNLDNFLTELRKKKTQRRRMLSLLLVLSLFVTSGVSWALHGVGMTMANEAECGIEEHTHTDECYEKVLVCTLEEDEAHTHTDACYEMQLICGKDEHIHDISCYTGEERPSDDAALLTAELADGTDPEEIELYEDTEDSGYDGMFSVTADETGDGEGEGSEGEGSEGGEGEGTGTDTGPPPTIQTVDNIAEGIKFTLFDYGNSLLESQNNHYGYVWDNDNHVWTHPNANMTDGINAGRNYDDDILFFAYGTPVDQNRSYSEDPVHNYVDSSGVRQYAPDKNSYSGDYNAYTIGDVTYAPYPGNRPVSGIVSDALPKNRENSSENGYPTINNSANHSLAYLFNPDSAYDAEGVRTTYTDVNHLLKEQINPDTGVRHLVFNSNENYAYYNKATGDFEVYNTTFEIVNKDHHKAKTTDHYKTYDEDQPDGHKKGDNVYYAEQLNDGFMIGFFPFDEYDAYRNDPNFDGAGYNHHFGMTMEASFTNTPYDGVNVKEPISFKYSGDDDMWVFVDGKLVLDIGGIHEPAGGMIDFSNGLVWVQDNGNNGKTLATVKEELNLTDSEWEALPKPIGIDTQNSLTTDGNKWVVTPMSTYISNWTSDNASYVNGTHEIKMFYLERGGCYSNLAMEMNLPTLKPLSVMKNVDYQEHLVKGEYEDDYYEFELRELVDGEWIVPMDIPLEDRCFSIQAGKRKLIEGLGQNRIFKVIEKNVNTDVIDRVKVNGEECDIAEGTVSSTGNALEDLNSYTFENRIREEFTDVYIKKKWEGSTASGFTVKYRILRTDSKSGEVKQVALVEEDETTHKLTKRRVFTIPPDKWEEGVHKDHLLSRYGDRTYTYSVEELNVPNGYEAKYSVKQTTNDLGQMVTTATITNTDVTKKDIYVKKQWDNVTDGNEPQIQLRLTRTRIGYEGQQPTSLTVNILDEGGNLIKTQTFYATDANKLYAGGSVEIAYNVPNGVALYDGDTAYPQKTITDGTGSTTKILSEDGANNENDTLYVKFERDEGILCVYNLAPIPEVQEGGTPVVPNVVTFKVITDKAEDSLLLLHHSFTRGTNGWVAQGDATITSSGNGPYAKGDAMLVQGRTGAWNGVKYYLDPDKFKPNKTYTFSAYVKSPDAEQEFMMTFNNGLNEYEWITNPAVTVGNGWTHLTGTIPLTKKIDPYNMFLLIETTSGTSNFYVDEFTAIEGSTSVSVDEDSGVVRIGEPSHVGYIDGTAIYNYETMQNYSANGWKNFGLPNGNDDLSPKEYDGNYAVVVSGRTASWQGVSHSVNLEHNKTYHINSVVAGHHDNNDSTTPHTINVSLKWFDSSDGDHYTPITSVNSYGNGWKTIDFGFQIPEDADTTKTMEIYYSAEDTSPFEVWSSKLYEATTTTIPGSATAPAPSGYGIEGGQYVSDYSNYTIIPDWNSVTNPKHLKGNQYVLDPDFEPKVITLPNSEGEAWVYHWQNYDIAASDPHYFEEDRENYLYKYQIEEVWIDSSGNVIRETSPGSGKWVSDNEDYIVTYENNDVATNDSDNPIVVTNKYIWYRLPATGGMGVDAIYVSGILLTFTGFIGGYALKRRERRFK